VRKVCQLGGALIALALPQAFGCVENNYYDDVGDGGVSDDPKGDGGSGKKDAGLLSEAGPDKDGGTSDASKDTSVPACTRAPLVGDLAITEVMFQAPEDTRWVEVLNTSSCKIELFGVSVESRRTTPGGIDAMLLKCSVSLDLAPGERAVFTQHPTFPPAAKRVVSSSSTLGWLLVPSEIALWHGTTVLQTLTMPENLGTTSRHARGQPEGICAKVNPLAVSTWPVSSNLFAPNAVDPGQRGSPGLPNVDLACPP